MIPLLDKRSAAEKKKAALGDTLQKLAAKAGLPDWKTIALFNWGTTEPAEVNRQLFETVGWEKADAADPGATKLVPHKDANREILIPKPWAKRSDFAIDTVHKLSENPPPLPPVAIRIDAISKWFIPGQESCDLQYSLEGLDANAKKVDLAVFGSNYCSLSDWNKGLPKFPAAADLIETPLYENPEQVAAPARSQGNSIAEWKGKVTAAAGALGTKNDGADRVINVAFSPYTAVLCYYLSAADKQARIDMDSFWPQFDTAGKADPESLKIRFAIRKTDRCASTNGGGTLLVWDGKDEVVFRKPLSLAELGKLDKGFKEFAWDGKYSKETKKNSKGGAVAIAEDMPYRVQIQAHTGPDQANGLGLAAMQTEVRLYVHPKTHRVDFDPYDAETDQTSLVLCTSDDLLITKPAARGDGTRWIQYQLAKAGFHAGPCDGSDARPAYKTALREFKRSIPKRKTGALFERFHPVNESEDDDVKNAVEDLSGPYAAKQRPWFGDATSRDALTLDAAQTILRDPAETIAVWADDRHYYTDAGWLPTCGTAATKIYNSIKSSKQAMGNYALDYQSRDAVINMKTNEIPRPWIPFAAGIPVMSKSQTLATETSFTEDAVKDMANAIGPIRIDWSMDEIDAAPPVDGVIDKTNYDAGVSRPKAYVEKILQNRQKTHPRKDIKKAAVYTNCWKNAGGVRPGMDSASYQEQVFGYGDDSLPPFRAVSDRTYETIVSVVHDNLGQGADDRVAKRFGQAGVFFRPSTIGGDGYRVRAQARFEPKDDYNFPNLAALKKRYPLLPQAQSAKMRVWRKASVRSYICWAPANNWAGTGPRMMEHFKEAYLHLEYENGDADVARAIGTWFQDNDDFKNLVKSAVDTTPAAPPADKERAKNANIKLNTQRLWPWHDAPQMGIFEASGPDATWDQANKTFYDAVSGLFYSLSNAFGLRWAQRIEMRTGKLRGHTIVEFQCGDSYYLQQYRCDSTACCGKKYYFVEKSEAGGGKQGEDCIEGLGGGKLDALPSFTGYYECENGHAGVTGPEDDVAGGKHKDTDCPTAGCKVFIGKYTCEKGHAHEHKEADAAGGALTDTPCPTKGCAVKYTGHYVCNSKTAPHEMDLEEKTEAGGGWVGKPCKECAALAAAAKPVLSNKPLPKLPPAPSVKGPSPKQPLVAPKDPAPLPPPVAPRPLPSVLTKKTPDVTLTPAKLQLQSVDERTGKLLCAQVDVVEYECINCGWKANLSGSPDADPCPERCGGLLFGSSKPAVKGNHVTIDAPKAWASSYTGIPVPSLGNPLGVSFNFDAEHELWAHELAHNRYMEHAANAGDPDHASHDHKPNTAFDWGAIGETDDEPSAGGRDSKSWDRACLMTYANQLSTYDSNRDRRVMCGKCNLKIRGWKIATVVDPDTTIHD